MKYILISLLFLGCAHNKCDSYNKYKSGRISWKTNIPIVFYLDDSVPDKYINDIIFASMSIQMGVGKKLIIIDPVKRKIHKNTDNVIYWVKDWKDSKTIQAYTDIYFKEDKIKFTKIYVNNDNFIYDENHFNLHALILHEFGHALGLKHVDKYDTIMYPYLGIRENRIYLSELDKQNLKCEY